ncbi:hypothetical protein [Faecalispora anaeroviscerum]|uniref:hypothetical protein n=1 Tax=Faecalispora anaeroviscerum TaxID=2991836 RepID=UPI0024B8F685|nr:hypothetical protein [Faecalispora anaeroviscerum]
MATNDTNDMQRMQQDAIRRVREMQGRAQQSLNRTPAVLPEPPKQESSSQHHHGAPPPQSALPALPLPQPSTLSNLFDGLLQDGERTLILVLILILVSEKADTGLIFALMYLII